MTSISGTFPDVARENEPVVATPDNIDSVAQRVLERYPIRRAAFFGSSARGDMTEESDIDMVVEFLPGRGGINFEFFGLHVDLQEAFKRHVDLLTFNALENEAKPQFRENVLSDLRYIYEREDLDYKNAHSEMPWKNISGMRNIAAHGYHSMSLPTVWDTVQTSVPELEKFLVKQLSEAKPG